MNKEERISLFAGVMPAVRAALTLDGNDAKFEACWTATDPDEFMPKLEAFAIGLGLSAYRFYPHQSPKLTARIAADVKIVSHRIGWHWTMWRVKARGRA
ncbi:hypothetical protein LPJGGPFB_05650 [Ensifer adhaerens]|uniref:hypothetical protein n=1 Tax=Ensifer adhaerens TaxID=106592 RepID=UPI0015682E28|nr:hypothetical protein [Ensifer adhaerens]NRP22391.1 hypothetical protein [Ensifer adhaerens]